MRAPEQQVVKHLSEQRSAGSTAALTTNTGTTTVRGAVVARRRHTTEPWIKE
jgi:hypothetical protein